LDYLLNNWWESPYATRPKPPGILGELGRTRSQKKGAQDLEAKRDITVKLQRYHPGEGEARGSFEDYELVIPRGTRLGWAGEGSGSGSNPPGKFLVVPVKLIPCPESFPKTGSSAADHLWAQFDQTQSKALYFQLKPFNMNRCVLDIHVYAPRFKDPESRAFSDALKVVTGPRPEEKGASPARIETPAVDSDSQDDRKSATPLQPPGSEPLNSETPSGTSAK
jgi:hypothetical protein